MTLNAPKGVRREAPRPFGGVFGHKTALKCQQKCPENVWGHFFLHFAEAQLDPRTFLTFFGPFVGDPQKSAPGPFLDIFRQFLVLTHFTS